MSRGCLERLRFLRPDGAYEAPCVKSLDDLGNLSVRIGAWRDLRKVLTAFLFPAPPHLEEILLPRPNVPKTGKTVGTFH